MLIRSSPLAFLLLMLPPPTLAAEAAPEVAPAAQAAEAVPEVAPAAQAAEAAPEGEPAAQAAEAAPKVEPAALAAEAGPKVEPVALTAKANPEGKAVALTEKPGHEGEPHVVSGMSIMGNNEAPKSLYIVPWKSSEIGLETKLTSSLLNEDMTPVDKIVFMRELDFYKLSNPQ
jgi:hypothetical protein